MNRIRTVIGAMAVSVAVLGSALPVLAADSIADINASSSPTPTPTPTDTPTSTATFVAPTATATPEAMPETGSSSSVLFTLLGLGAVSALIFLVAPSRTK